MTDEWIDPEKWKNLSVEQLRGALPGALLAAMQLVLADAGEALSAADVAWNWIHAHGHLCWIDGDGCSIYPLHDGPSDDHELALILMPQRLSTDDHMCLECSPHACNPSTHEREEP